MNTFLHNALRLAVSALIQIRQIQPISFRSRRRIDIYESIMISTTLQCLGLDPSRHELKEYTIKHPQTHEKGQTQNLQECIRVHVHLKIK